VSDFWSYVNNHGEGFFWFCLFIGLPALGIIGNTLVGVFRAVLRVPTVHCTHTTVESNNDEDGDED